MNIIEALKKENIRISNGRRWLIWEETLEAWVVYGREYAMVIRPGVRAFAAPGRGN